MNVCVNRPLLPIYTIHAVIVLTTIYHEIHVEITDLRIDYMCHISLFAAQRKK